MQVGNPIILEWYGYLGCSCGGDPQYGTCRRENNLHERFDSLRVNKEYNPDSEWFEADRKLVEHIDKLKSDNKLCYDDGEKFNGKWVDGFGPRSSQ